MLSYVSNNPCNGGFKDTAYWESFCLPPPPSRQTLKASLKMKRDKYGESNPNKI